MSPWVPPLNSTWQPLTSGMPSTTTDAGVILKVPTSEFSCTVHGILQGLHINSKGALGSILVEGRVLALWVMNLAEFQYATQALKRAHSKKDNFAFDLLIAVRDIVPAGQNMNGSAQEHHQTVATTVLGPYKGL